MAINTQNQYMPDFVSPPGETLLETLETIGMTQVDLAERTGRPTKTINKIIHGKTAITPETALQLERVLGTPARFWINRERHYRESLARAEEREKLQEQVGWLKKIPVKAMINFGWIRAFENQIDQLVEVIQYYGVSSPEQWGTLWMAEGVSFRQSPSFKSDPGAVSAWLRRGELVARDTDCRPYNETGFREALTAIRSLTTLPPQEFIPAMREFCAKAGVVFAVVPELPKTITSGATRWLSPDKALIQLSLRYKRDDQFWFTFFHEAGHILLHGKRDIFIEGEQDENGKEEEANQFSADFLIPPKAYAQFMPSGLHYSQEDVLDFASQIGIAPGIVVGRLQKDKKIEYRHLNGLKLPLNWESIGGMNA